MHSTSNRMTLPSLTPKRLSRFSIPKYKHKMTTRIALHTRTQTSINFWNPYTITPKISLVLKTSSQRSSPSKTSRSPSSLAKGFDLYNRLYPKKPESKQHFKKSLKIKCDLETLNTNTDVMPVSSNQRRSSICRKALGDLIIFEQTQRNETPKIKSNDKTKRTFTLQAADTVVAIKSDIEKLLENREISRRLKSKTD